MASIKPEEITSILKTKIEKYNVETDVNSIGSVLSVGDGIARLYGLRNAMSSELVEFDDESWYSVNVPLTESSFGERPPTLNVYDIVILIGYVERLEHFARLIENVFTRAVEPPDLSYVILYVLE